MSMNEIKHWIHTDPILVAGVAIGLDESLKVMMTYCGNYGEYRNTVATFVSNGWRVQHEIRALLEGQGITTLPMIADDLKLAIVLWQDIRREEESVLLATAGVMAGRASTASPAVQGILCRLAMFWVRWHGRGPLRPMRDD